MRSSFPTEESIYVIDSTDYVGKYIFPDYSADAKIHQNVNAVVVGGINGNRTSLVKAFKETNRNSDFRLVNVRKVKSYDTLTVEVPADILAKVNRFNELMPKLRKEQMNNLEKDMELFNEVSDLHEDLVNYFER